MTMSPIFKSGDLVRINNDIEIVRQLQEGHGGWNDEMQRALGGTGRVTHVTPYGDLAVEVNGAKWTFNPVCCALDGPARQQSAQQSCSSEQCNGEIELFVALVESLNAELDVAQVHQRLGPAAAVPIVTSEGYPELQNAIVGEASDMLALHAACRRGDTEVIRNYISINADLNAKDRDGNTALHHAVLGATAEGIELLLKHKSAINERNSRGCTALHLAVAKSNSGCVSVLLYFKCDVNIQDYNGNTALHIAVEQNNADVITKLVDHGCANYGLCNDLGFNVLQHAVSVGSSGAVKKLLTVTRHLTDLRNDDGLAPLHIAAAYGHANVMEVLIEEGRANLELRNDSKQTPFLLAVFHGNQQAADCLLESGADMQAQDDKGNTCLHYAVTVCGGRNNGEADAGTIAGTGSYSSGNELLLYLLNRGADISLFNHAGKSVLDLAHCDSVRQILLEYVVNDEAATAMESNPGASVSTTTGSRSRAVVPSSDLAELERLRQLEQNITCPICFDRQRNRVFNCGHTICSFCSENLKQCHECRKCITSILPFFM